MTDSHQSGASMECITSAEGKHLAEQSNGKSDAPIDGNHVGNSTAATRQHIFPSQLDSACATALA